MDDQKIMFFKQWAPEESPWSVWAKPVLFASMTMEEFREVEVPALPEVEWASRLDKSTAIVVDLPGEESILTALVLAQKGYRPVPLFNCCKGPAMLINVSSLTRLLVTGARIISESSIRPDAPPVFMLDSRRMEAGGVTNYGKFDNRWCIVPQDMPSAKYLKDSGISNVLLYSTRVREDISHILCRYQQSNIKIIIGKDSQTIENIDVHPPSSFRSLLYRWGVLWGLKRNSAGGFGAIVPEPTTSTSGARMG